MKKMDWLKAAMKGDKKAMEEAVLATVKQEEKIQRMGCSEYYKEEKRLHPAKRRIGNYIPH